MAIVRIVRQVTYEIDEQYLPRLRDQMHLSMPVGQAVQGQRCKDGEPIGPMNWPSITIEHISGPQWEDTDGKHNTETGEELQTCRAEQRKRERGLQ